MKVSLHRKNDETWLEGINPKGHTAQIDGTPAADGSKKGASPMELFLMSLAGCSSMDVIGILKKQRQVIEEYSVEVSGVRALDQTPSVFTDIHLKFILKGDIKPQKVEKAIKMSMDTYCSVSMMVKATVNVTTAFEIVS